MAENQLKQNQEIVKRKKVANSGQMLNKKAYKAKDGKIIKSKQLKVAKGSF